MLLRTKNLIHALLATVKLASYFGVIPSLCSKGGHSSFPDSRLLTQLFSGCHTSHHSLSGVFNQPLTSLKQGTNLVAMKPNGGHVTDILTNIHMLQEAWAVMYGIKIERKYNDRELEGYQYELSVAKTDIEEMNAENDQQSRQYEDRP